MGKQVLGATKYASPEELALGFEKVRGVKARAEEVKLQDWSLRLPEVVRDEMGENMEMLGTTGYYGHASLGWSTSVSKVNGNNFRNMARLISNLLASR